MSRWDWIRIGGALILLLLGGTLLYGAATVGTANDFAHSGESQYWVTIVSSDVPSPEDDVINYSELPPEAQRSFTGAIDGERGVLWEDEDARAINLLDEYEIIRYQGQKYAYGVAHAHMDWGTIWGLMLVFIVMGVGMTASGAWLLYRSR